MLDKHGKPTSYVYKMQHEQCQKTLKLWDMDQVLLTIVLRHLTSTTKSKPCLTKNQLKLSSNTNIEIRGQNKKKEFFILATFSSIAEAKTFENQAAEARKKGVSKMKTQRMDHQDVEAFPLVMWQNALKALKAYANERVAELKLSHKGDNEAMARIDTCNE